MADFDPMKSATEMVKNVRVSSVLGSLLWILPFLIAALVITSFGSNLVIQGFFMYATAIDFGIIILSFIGILLFGDKKLLLSEDHIYRMKHLEIIGDQSHTIKKGDHQILVTNPALPDPSTIVVPPPPTKEICA